MLGGILCMFSCLLMLEVMIFLSTSFSLLAPKTLKAVAVFGLEQYPSCFVLLLKF